MKKKRYHGKRTLLNLPGHESIAAITAEIENTSTWRKGKDFNGNDIKHKWNCGPSHMILKISDCSRSVDLSVSINTEARYQNSIHKVSTMIEALESFRDGLVIERERYIERLDNLPTEEQEEDDD